VWARARSLSKRASKSKRVPRFSVYGSSSPKATAWGRGNRASNTEAERRLRSAFRRFDLRPRSDNRSLPGRPDFTFGRRKLAVFVDGDFWHGRRWRQRKAKLTSGTNSAYWKAKIDRNRARDREVTRSLRLLGWRVLRFWETDVLNDPDRVARAVMKPLRGRWPKIDDT
jgi:DNA mismatch endonuclease, patch repair protein